VSTEERFHSCVGSPVDLEVTELSKGFSAVLARVLDNPVMHLLDMPVERILG